MNDYDFKHEAAIVCEAIDSKIGNMTVECALREAFTAGQADNPLQRAVAQDPGCLQHAARLLRWWAEDESDEPDVVEMIQQSKEVADTLDTLDAAAAKPSAAPEPDDCEPLL